MSGTVALERHGSLQKWPLWASPQIHPYWILFFRFEQPALPLPSLLFTGICLSWDTDSPDLTLSWHSQQPAQLELVSRENTSKRLSTEQEALLLEKGQLLLIKFSLNKFSIPRCSPKAWKVKSSVSGELTQRQSGKTSVLRLILHVGRNQDPAFSSHPKFRASKHMQEHSHSSCSQRPGHQTPGAPAARIPFAQ